MAGLEIPSSRAAQAVGQIDSWLVADQAACFFAGEAPVLGEAVAASPVQRRIDAEGPAMTSVR
jgi:hypothetical protein